ncbi:hypothetical protein [Bacillus sp. AFS017336]|uniref:hypothetical protein n=1 Tax=Bacillus sp. AFS017336 TaxID=2033489 RepID=UPI000BF15C9B|nr:hypothetical protein [Bacillus sp. AFS017336]PEL13050.1 hypothetical protein CN601_06065 [Bacillus sp. AFS017336]
MLNNKKFLTISIILFLICIGLSINFPNDYTLGAKASVNNIPITKDSGINYKGVIWLFFFVISLYFLAKAIKKYKARIIILAIIISAVSPPYLTYAYQNTIATGIYAISYESQNSECNFDKVNETTLHGVCELNFKNYSSKAVHFNVDFYDKYPFEEEVQMLSLMKIGAPYSVNLAGNETKRVKIETDIDLSKMKHHIDGGGSNDVHIMISSGDKTRKL